MKIHILIFLIGLGSTIPAHIALGATKPESAPPPTTGNIGGAPRGAISAPGAKPKSTSNVETLDSKWELVWSDEFDYSGLPDPSKWDYEEGFIRNQEQQYYTRSRLQNARVENGMLVLEGRKELYKPKRKTNRPVGYTSASIVSKGAGFLYGRIEIKAKIPSGAGVWPALWLMGTNIKQVGWPQCGEIDVMENVGKEPNSIHGTMHYYADGGHQLTSKELKSIQPSEDFHIYAIEWYTDRMDFFYDTTMYLSVPLNKTSSSGYDPFHKPQYIIMNFALGGSWPGAVSDKILPQKFLIDYVRVYKIKG